MNSTAVENWHEANQRYLLAALDQVRCALESHRNSCHESADGQSQTPPDEDQLARLAETMETPPAIETLCRVLGLSLFERAVLLMCAGVELDASFASLLTSASGPSAGSASFSTALAALPEAHWSALSPAAPLRYWRLVELADAASVTTSPLRIDEWTLHYLTGVDYLDDRLRSLVRPLGSSNSLVPSHAAVAERLGARWAQDAGQQQIPALHLQGPDPAPLEDIAAAVCNSLTVQLHCIPVFALPTDLRELDALIRIWQRGAVLSNRALLLDCHQLDAGDTTREQVLTHFVDITSVPLLVTSRQANFACRRPTVAVEVDRPTANEQRELWQAALSGSTAELNGEVDQVVAQFNLGSAAIRSAGSEVLSRGEGETVGSDAEIRGTLGSILWDVCRRQTRPQLDRLAQRIEPSAAWDDLVLPAAQLRRVREVAIHVKQRLTVYEHWGFAAKSPRGLGISALFAGPSGTGKTMAAEVLAGDLRLDLYRIDLSQVVSKYIGETEKNLRRVFDAAEGSGAILLFDEADALFGKRSEVKDSHDRYANIEISYLLQRMESYRGLAILTTNMQGALDDAFLRRIRFTVRFPFPGPSERAEIWRRIFPRQAPTENIDAAKLSRLNVSGGNIRNMALYAAFLAAEADQPVRMSHLHRAAQVEYAKLEKPLTNAETGDWL